LFEFSEGDVRFPKLFRQTVPQCKSVSDQIAIGTQAVVTIRFQVLWNDLCILLF